MIIQKKYSGITVPVLTPVLEGETMSLTQAERDRAIRTAGL